ncbi:4-hydroxyphenylpyruvate dioxygenase [Brasilonema octagenarum UFV-E1]|uniref:4-hydroxyphenylpyruvate dioxygenase n=1 Tax=Brasilonema sennae CENA114 TaxID=415709 RepID=A0A856MDN5_9CYAN|nr:4-hydroxyphenylpyruvate dioxygenase [Brasilonema sennae]QDL09293.1 4-hydroxyphenylpyruvate dioxygenase [Brasilonema sennae CENA114]QDL15650.1 4-hydroxyphenylpyruvate dioxygenase [Brasilonema octagenarum UFV-E1]
MKIDHVHFYVEDAKVWRDWFVRHLGFQVVEKSSAVFPTFLEKVDNIRWKAGENNTFDTCTQVLKSGAIYFLLSSPLLPTSPVAEFLRHHPAGVADVAFCVENLEEIISLARVHGAKILQPIQQYEYGQEYIKCSKIAAWGSLTHTLIETKRGTEQRETQSEIIKGCGSVEKHPSLFSSSSSWFTGIDHIVLNVNAGDLEHAVAWYENILNFQGQQRFNIQTSRSGLHSQVMVSGNGDVQLPINQPGSANSQIQEFLNLNRGSGIQHIALRTRNIVHAIAEFRATGLSLLPVPKDYYSQIRQRKGLPITSDELDTIAGQEILVDWKEEICFNSNKNITPVLLQIFTQPIFGQPTFFFEFIERRYQAQGFGEGNFRTLFAAIENEQIKRASLG